MEGTILRASTVIMLLEAAHTQNTIRIFSGVVGVACHLEELIC